MSDKKVLPERVNHPQHYGGDTTYETIKVLEAWLTPDEYRGFLKGNELKYLSRAGKKGDEAEDRAKARWYGDALRAYDEKQKDAPPAPINHLVIRLTRAEVQSGFDRVRQAEALIRQLPSDHDGRNTWLMNYGTLGTEE